MRYFCGMSLRFVLYMLSLWFLFRFVTGYVLPLFRSGDRVSEGRPQARGDAEEAPRRSSSTEAGKADGADYLDFEEVR
jgi:hypothetical protein